MDFTEDGIIAICARAIADGTRCQINLLSLDDYFGGPDLDSIANALRMLTEKYSDNTITLRDADSILFAEMFQGRSLRLVVCPIDTPADMVTELAEGMILVEIAPYDNGFQYNMTAATPQQLARRYVRRSGRRRMSAEAALLKPAPEAEAAAIADFLTQLTRSVEQAVRDYGNAGLEREYLKRRAGKRHLSLEDVAYFATKMEVSIKDFTPEA